MKNLILFLLAGMALFSCRKDLNSEQTQTFHPRSYSGIEPYTDSYDEAALNLDDSEDERINKAIIIAALALEDYICDATFQDALLNYLSNNNQEFMWLSDLMDILSESQAYDQRIEQTNPFTNFSGFSDLAYIDDNLEHSSIAYGIAIGVLLGSTTNALPLLVTAVELDDIDSTYEDNVLGWLPTQDNGLGDPLYISEDIAFSNGEGLVISLAVYPLEESFTFKGEEGSEYGSPSESARNSYFDPEVFWELPKMVIKYRLEKSGRSEIGIIGIGVDPLTPGTWDLFYSHAVKEHTSWTFAEEYYFSRYKKMVRASKNDVNINYVHVGTSWPTDLAQSNTPLGYILSNRPRDVAVNGVYSNYISQVGMYYTVYEHDWNSPYVVFGTHTDVNTNHEVSMLGKAKYKSDWYLNADCSSCNQTWFNQSSQIPKYALSTTTITYVEDLPRIKVIWEDYSSGLNP